MSKEIYTKQELVENSVVRCEAIIDFEIREKGYIGIVEYQSLVSRYIDSLYNLRIIGNFEYVGLLNSMDKYRQKQNELGARGEL